MEKWKRLLGIVVICMLVAGVGIPISLANPDRIEFEGKLPAGFHVIPGIDFQRYRVGELHKGDTIKVVMTDIRGNTPVTVHVGQSVRVSIEGLEYYFPGEKTFTLPTDGIYNVYIFIRPPIQKGDTVLYKGYAEW
jgi:hypothetical protein